ncbi:MAG: NAD-dependent epimerase/dehydratase family protein [Hyphomicrobiaceae bacterium]|nr:NAD-dependent epimerase/dehydratase family protein [Hyphomicrobiaceae bacterium]
MTRILVTGASGFIGYAVTEALAARGDEVIATDQAIGPRLQALATRHSILRAVPGEITEWPHLVGLVKEGRPDKVVHCAAVVGVPASVGSPINTFRINIEGTIHLLEAMRLFDVKRMVNISSEEIYGPFQADVIDEEHPCRPTKPYGISKFVVEQVARDYAAAYGLECIHTRTCWVYGPYYPRQRAPRNLLEAAITGRPLHLPGGKAFSVDQVHIDDVVQGILLALDKPRHRFDAYHIATGVSTSLADVVAMIRERLPEADISIGPGPLTFVDGTEVVRKGALSIARAREELGYAPRYDMRTGLDGWIDLLLAGKG